MECHFFTRYDAQGASSRARSYQFLPLIERAGHRAIVHPLLEREYLLARYEKRAVSPAYLAKRYLRRASEIAQLPQGSVVVIEKELYPYLPGATEVTLRTRGHTLVVDFDDAIFRNYTDSPRSVIRWLLGDKIPAIMKGADLVTVGSHYLADYAAQHSARKIIHIPTTIDLDRYVPAPAPPSPQLRIGWIGTPLTTEYLRLVTEALAELSTLIPIKVICIGSGVFHIPDVEIEVLPWSLEKEVEYLNQIDVGIMPLSSGQWEQGKCAYKLVQCMALAKPVVASAVGENRHVVRNGVTGLLASDHAQWISHLLDLARSPELRSLLGTAGRKEVEERYSLQAIGPQLVTALEVAHAERQRSSTSLRRGISQD